MTEIRVGQTTLNIDAEGDEVQVAQLLTIINAEGDEVQNIMAVYFPDTGWTHLYKNAEELGLTIPLYL